MTQSASTRFVAIEGIAGVGKSTLCRLLADRHGALVIRMSPPFRQLRDELSRTEHLTPMTRLLNYLAGTAQMTEEIASAPASSRVVADRYLASPLALAEAEGTIDAAHLTELARILGDCLPKPAITILLTANHDDIRQRMADRATEAGKDVTVHELTAASQRFSDAWSSAIERWCQQLGPVAHIDTTARSIEEVYHEAERVLSHTAQGPSLE